MGDLCKLPDVKAWLGVGASASGDDVLLKRLITATSADFLSEIDRYDFAAADYTETKRGRALDAPLRFPTCELEPKSVLALRHWPINSVASLVLDGTTIAASDGSSSGYLLDTNTDPENRQQLQLVGYLFTSVSIATVTYSAGYATTPGDVEQAVIDWVAARYRMRQSIGISSFRATEGQSQSEAATYQPWDMPKSTQRVAERYKGGSLALRFG